ncbi:MAG: outer membrane protein [Xanthobacteraceae bacterium]
MGARAGILLDPTTLLFGSAGIAAQRIDTAGSCFGNGMTTVCDLSHASAFSDTRLGWTVGAGVEKMLWNNLIARAEYRYSDFGGMDKMFFSLTGPFDDRVFANIKSTTQIGLIGLSYKFGPLHIP